MARLTFEGNFCDIAMCTEVCGGSFCEDGYCSQRKVWERLKRWEDLEEQGRLIILGQMKDGAMETEDDLISGSDFYESISAKDIEAALAASGKEG